MKQLFYIAILLMALQSCKQSNNKSHEGSVLYHSDQFTLYSDGVKQGRNESIVYRSDSIVSNYKSLESETFSRKISLKLSLNEKDNEGPAGADHILVIQDEAESPIMTFGMPDSTKTGAIDPNDPYLPKNYKYTFRVNMKPVLQQFEEQGYYECYDGSRVAKDDFKGVYVAGSANPLTWDFVNLANKGLQLTDSDADSIYTLTVTLNPFNPEDAKDKKWSLSQDISQKPIYQSEQPIVDALFKLSLEEAILNIEEDSTLRTGAKWGGVWTRDVSYSILLAFAYHEPEVAKISLMRKVKRNRIIQDTGSGGAWPVSSDRTTWALAAWEIYKVTGDRKWLSDAYNILQHTLEDDDKTLKSQSGLYRGESSFLDWREQTYPKWMSNTDIYVSENLGTNVVHYQAHKIAGMMADELDVNGHDFHERAATIKAAINEQLWMDDRGYYAQYTYGRKNLMKSPRFEALGEALAVLFDVADEKQAKAIFEKSPVTPFGTTCIYPQIPGIPPYHNNGIWPFVQSYWNWAAAKAGNETALNHGLAAIYRAGGLFLTNYENFVADNGDYMGTEINSHRMLWSMAGNLAMVHRLFIGMNFEQHGIRFQPVIPQAYGGERTLSNFHYRDMLLTIKVNGYGNEIKSITLNGDPLKDAFLPNVRMAGEHTIEIEMANNDFSQPMNLVPNQFSPNTPQASLSADTLAWKEVQGVKGYEVFRNGELFKATTETTLLLDSLKSAEEYAVRAIGHDGTSSFFSEPILRASEEDQFILHAETFAPKSNKPYTNYTGRGFVEITQEMNRLLIFKFKAPQAGKYLIDLRYSNGTGPWNTDNNCGIRSLFINDDYRGVCVFPQRGTDEWSDWGYSNGEIVELQEGDNEIKIAFETWNTNMDGEINTAMIDHLRLIKLN